MVIAAALMPLILPYARRLFGRLAPELTVPAAGLLEQVLPLTAGQRGQMYLFASLPPAVTCFMMAEQYRQEPDKVAAIVLLGNLAALIFVPIGLWLGLVK